MTSRRSWVWKACLGVAVAVAPARAWAQADPAAAQALFDDAMALMKADKYAEACPKLEASLRLDPGMGTEYNLAGCDEHEGRLARAWAHFVNVADAAHAAHQPEREKGARHRAQELEPRLPRLTIVIPPALAHLTGLEVTRDGVPVPQAQWGLATPVDPGAHTIAARAAGKKPWSQNVQTAERARVDLTVPPLEDDVVAPPPPPLRPDATPAPAPSGPVLTPRRGIAIAVGAVGVVGLVVGAVFGAKAKSAWSDTLASCRNGDPTWCYPGAFGSHDSAVTSATISSASLAIGGAAVVAGVITWFVPEKAAPPRAGVRVLPMAGARAGGAVVEARF